LLLAFARQIAPHIHHMADDAIAAVNLRRASDTVKMMESSLLENTAEDEELLRRPSLLIHRSAKSVDGEPAGDKPANMFHLVVSAAAAARVEAIKTTLKDESPVESDSDGDGLKPRNDETGGDYYLRIKDKVDKKFFGENVAKPYVFYHLESLIDDAQWQVLV
jgi:hypothetical protein